MVFIRSRRSLIIFGDALRLLTVWAVIHSKDSCAHLQCVYTNQPCLLMWVLNINCVLKSSACPIYTSQTRYGDTVIVLTHTYTHINISPGDTFHLLPVEVEIYGYFLCRMHTCALFFFPPPLFGAIFFPLHFYSVHLHLVLCFCLKCSLFVMRFYYFQFIFRPVWTNCRLWFCVLPTFFPFLCFVQ